MSSLVVQEDPRNTVAAIVADMWVSLNNQRAGWLSRVTETRAYVTAPTTVGTEVGNSLPWKNKTTIPILTQIADNLQSFYMAALMPAEDWFRFEGRDEESQLKANLVEEYLGSKLRLGGFRKELEKLVRDWVIYGNCIGGVTFVTEKATSLLTTDEIITYRGPKLTRISPIDCVMDSKAPSFDKSPLIIRRMVPLVEVLTHNETHHGSKYNEEVLEQVRQLRLPGQQSDFVEQYKAQGLEIDGFSTFDDYLGSQYIELLEFWGDVYDMSTNTSYKNRVMTIVDRGLVLRDDANPSWNGKKPFFHVGWRILPDNLYGQGPLDNLVGMQYRINHLENLKADAYDQIIHPFMKIRGDEVDDFEFGPGNRVYVGTDGDVEFLRPDVSVLTANNEVEYYRNLMEFTAGSPRESAGFRTPGEKTAFEVSILDQGSTRIFQDKLNHFEELGIQVVLGLMFELLMRNFELEDVARTFNGDEQSLILTTITKEAVVADGVFRPMGAKHFAARNKRLQELQNLLMISQNDMLKPHFSGVNAGKMLQEELGWEKYMIFSENVGVREQFLAQQLALELAQTTAETIEEPEL